MSTRGFENWTESDVARHSAKVRRPDVQTAIDVAMPETRSDKPSKYHNVKIVIDGQKFDSKREAAYWQTLKIREQLGEIGDLRRQIALPLMCPTHGAAAGVASIVAEYVADYTYIEVKDQSFHVVDAKGKRTRMFDLKAKWLELQSGIVIETV